MIIIKLKGGLGNQMFQYALGRNLSIKYNSQLKLVFTHHKGDSKRKYSLWCFNLPTNVKSQTIYSKILDFLIIKLTPNGKILRQKDFHFNSQVFNNSDKIIYDGYWQTEKYFVENEQTLRKDFSFKHPLIGKNLTLMKKILKANSVAIHIRRSDYLKNETTKKIHGICDLSYYLKAIKLISKMVQNPYFFVFSDDINWAKSSLAHIENIIFVDWNQGDESYKDLYLMSLCKHAIIANSSFSWWGAWLNRNKCKIIIAPKKWFNDKNINTKDLLPWKWIKI